MIPFTARLFVGWLVGIEALSVDVDVSCSVSSAESFPPHLVIRSHYVCICVHLFGNIVLLSSLAQEVILKYLSTYIFIYFLKKLVQYQ